MNPICYIRLSPVSDLWIIDTELSYHKGYLVKESNDLGYLVNTVLNHLNRCNVTNFDIVIEQEKS